MNKKKNLILLVASMGCFFLSAVSIVVLSLGPSVARLSGIMFWAFMVAGIALQVLLTKRVNEWRTTYRSKMKRSMRVHRRIGLLSFFENPYGMVSDIAVILSVILFVVIYYRTEGMGMGCYISLALIIFSFCSHCVLNGKNYYYIVNQQTIEDMQEKMMEESQ